MGIDDFHNEMCYVEKYVELKPLTKYRKPILASDY